MLKVAAMATAVALLTAIPASAQQPTEYGPGLTLELAKKAAQAAEAEATKNGWHMAIAVVTSGGYLVHFSRMDQTQFGSIQVAQQKAKASALYRRPSKAFEDGVKAGNVALLMLEGAVPFEGGHPLVKDGKVIGAIGCSGGSSPQDGQACKAGADTIK